MEVILTLLLQITDKINFSGSIRLLDLGLIIIALGTIIRRHGVIRTNYKLIWILSIVWIGYIWLVLILKGKTNIGQFFSIGYFVEFLLTLFIVENLKLKFDRLWNFGFWIMFINSICAILQFLISGGTSRGYGFIGSTLGNYALPFVLYGIFCFKHTSLLRKIGLFVTLAAIFSSLQRTLIMVTLLGIILYILLEMCIEKKYITVLKQSITVCVSTVILWFLLPQGLKSKVLLRFYEVFNSSGDTHDSMQERYALWEVAINLFKQNPILGIGKGSFARLSLIDFANNITGPFNAAIVGYSTHNTFLEYLCETGLIGTFLIYSLVIMFVKRSLLLNWHNKNDIIFKILLISCITLIAYDLFGQSTFYPFWDYNVLLLLTFSKNRSNWNKVK